MTNVEICFLLIADSNRLAEKAFWISRVIIFDLKAFLIESSYL